MTTKHRAVIPHLPALDGLRGLAVIGVVLFHADGLLPGGYLGVDLFFVLSGFLITSILLAEHRETGGIHLGTFWVRRARRLFPALLSLMPAIALYAIFFARNDELRAIRWDAIATLGYVANWRSIFSEKSYWDLFLAPSPLEHTWSLAIEEQFYVLWPLLVTLVLVWLRRSRRALLGMTLALLAASAIASLVLYSPEKTSRVYFGTDTRACAILAGAALAMATHGQTPSAKTVRALDIAGIVATLVLGVAWMKLRGEAPLLYRGGFWLTEIACLVLIACGAAGSSSIFARVLSVAPLTYVGSISYGVYLWHWPIDCVLTPERTHLGSWSLFAVRMGLTIAIAALSFRFFERPIRSRGLPFRGAYIVAPVAFATAALLVVHTTRPRPLPQPVLLAIGSPRAWPTPYSIDFRALPPASELEPGTRRILLLGDSVAGKLGVALRYRQDEFHAFVGERSVGNCSILQVLSVRNFVNGPKTGGCAERWVDDVRELKPDITFIVLGGGYFAKMDIDGKSVSCCDRRWHDAYVARLEALIDEMGKDAGTIAIMLAPYPIGRWRWEGKATLDYVDCFNKLLREVAEKKKLTTVDTATHICPTSDCIMFSAGEPIRPDGLHPDGKGAEEMARFTLGELLREPPRVTRSKE